MSGDIGEPLALLLINSLSFSTDFILVSNLASCWGVTYIELDTLDAIFNKLSKVFFLCIILQDW